MTTPHAVLHTLLSWPVGSQQVARRNALLASTELAQRSHERREVEEFLDEHARRRRRVVTGRRTALVAEEHNVI